MQDGTVPDAPEPMPPQRRPRPAPPPIERLLLIIGAMKSGTTTLYQYLAQHPQVASNRRKEPNFFGAPGGLRRRRRFYLRQWPDFDPVRHLYAMEASTHYTKAPQYPRVPQRIRNFGLEARLIYIVRDPVDRIESHIAHNIAQGRVGHDIAWDDPMLRRAIHVSCYARQLARYARAMPDNPVLVLDFDELRRDPLAVTARCVDFLGLDPSFAFTPIAPANVRRPDNAGDSFRLSEEMRARLRTELAPDAQRFASRHGFDISAWNLG